jgi:hypothetical protein
VNKVVVLLIIFLLFSCSKDNDPLTSAVNDDRANDEQAIIDLINSMESESSDENYFYMGLDDELEDGFDDPNSLDKLSSPAVFSLTKPIIPVKFRRIIRPYDRDLEIIEQTDSTATVLFTKYALGRFVILANGNISSVNDKPDSFYRVIKWLGHKVQRYARFSKNDSAKWKLRAVSLASGESLSKTDSAASNTTIEIAKVLLQVNEGEVIEIAEPLRYFVTRESAFHFDPGDRVTVTVYLMNSMENPVYYPDRSTEKVRIHIDRHHSFKPKHQNKDDKHRIRNGFAFHRILDLRFEGKEGDLNVYKGSWEVRHRIGVNHAVIDVIDNGTIYDDAEDLYPYNSVTWHSPYIITSPSK